MDDLYLHESLSEESLASDFIGVTNATGKKGRNNAIDREEVEDNNEAIMGLPDLALFAKGKKK